MISRRQFTERGSLLAASLLTIAPKSQAQLQAPGSPSDRILRVGPGRAVQSLAQAARQAQPGQRIEVDAGNYVADVAIWAHDDIELRAVGGRVRLLAAGAAAEGKAIWVIRANRMQAQGFDFEGCNVPGRNGAGIRFERGSLRLRDCSFTLNEMGLLTSNDAQATLAIENCEFAHNMRPDGHNHNLYVGAIARLSVTGSYFHHARVGHLLKSRAATNLIFYNRLTDESGGSASYELEFPNGGVSYVVGNLIGQSAQTDNPLLISVGAEGYKWPRNELYVVNNTLVNLLPNGGDFLRVISGAQEIQAVNNLLVGFGTVERAGLQDYRNNFNAEPSDFANLAAHDVRLTKNSGLLGRAIDAGSANGLRLKPAREYAHPRGTRGISATKHNPGAMQSVA